ncbi:MAG: hypothetical protein LBV38_07905 [Alistipes sp.]|jgi:hypothetical protein|nr:hypothetical protein [Alistipes sp.]
MKKILLFLALALCGCTGTPTTPDTVSPEPPAIFPDYADCTIPPNVAPLNFTLAEPFERATVTFTGTDGQWSINARGGQFTIPATRWKKLLAANVGGSVSVRIAARRDGQWTAYAPFDLHISPDPVDPYIAYRLIEPGYDMWSVMGLYQRDLEGYRQSPIIENRLTDGSCMNCHSFRMQDPDQMLYHLRGPNAGTMILKDGEIEKLNTKTDQTLSALVYPSWHPSGRFVAFSVNDTKQAFHMSGPNRVEVYDNVSDVVVYDVERHEIVSSPLIHDTDSFESMPTFSPDGRRLYFSVSEFVPDILSNHEAARYSICSMEFDPETRSFGERVDTLYNARTRGGNATFPRVSPDGRFLMYTRSDHSTFAIWHTEADLWLIDLEAGSDSGSGEHIPLTAANSDDAESYHSWSSNSRWIVFSSRRTDGAYTRPFIAHVDAEGTAGKAFLLPQRDVDFYDDFMYSYNVPEFISGRVKDQRRRASRIAKTNPGIDVRFSD